MNSRFMFIVFAAFTLFSEPVTAANQPPYVAAPIPDQNAIEHEQFDFVFSPLTFGDSDVGDVLAYSATLGASCSSDGDCTVATSGCSADNYCTLPDWLAFEPPERRFSGTPNNDAVFDSPLTIRVVAEDSGGLSTWDSFTLSVLNTNDPPYVAVPIPDQFAKEYQLFHFAFSALTFVDLDFGDTLSYAATLDTSCSVEGDCAVAASVCGASHYCTLPAWLSFEPSKRLFSGVPRIDAALDSPLSVRVVAEDEAGSSAFDVFDISIEDSPDPPDRISRNGFEGVLNIDITPAESVVVAGLQEQFKAMCTETGGARSDCTTVVTWEVDNELIAVVENVSGNEGSLTALSVGNATILASLDNVVGSAQLTVTPAELIDLVVTPHTGQVPSGFHQQFIATGEYTDGRFLDLTESVTWSSGSDLVATVENSPSHAGRVLGQDAAASPNPVLITATDSATGHSDAALLTVTDDELCGIQINPDDVVIKEGTVQQFNAIGAFCLAGTEVVNTFWDLSTHHDLAWNTTVPPEYGVIGNEGGTKGLFEAISAYNTWFDIWATLDGIRGGTGAYIREPKIDSVRVELEYGDAPVGLSFQASCIAVNEDLEEVDVTLDPATYWRSSSEPIADIFQNGVVRPNGVNQGADFSLTLITCIYQPPPLNPGPAHCNQGMCVSSEALTVHDCVAEAIAVEPEDVTVANGDTQQFMAFGDFVYRPPDTPSAFLPCKGVDEATFDVTAIARWKSSDINVAVMVDPAAQPGLFQVVTGDGSITTIQVLLDNVFNAAVIRSSP